MGDQEYLVRGACLECSCGSHPRKLNLPKCHGVYITGHPMIHQFDSVPIENIAPFGMCSILQAPCVPATLAGWVNVHERTLIRDNDSRTPYPSVTTDSFLICAVGGIIEPLNSGQEPRPVELKEVEFTPLQQGIGITDNVVTGVNILNTAVGIGTAISSGKSANIVARNTGTTVDNVNNLNFVQRGNHTVLTGTPNRGLGSRWKTDNLNAGNFPTVTQTQQNLNNFRNMNNVARVTNHLGNAFNIAGGITTVAGELVGNQDSPVSRRVGYAGAEALVYTASTAVSVKVGATVGVAAGAKVGAKVGAAIGSVVPVAGTLVGAVVGTAIGAGAGWLVNAAADWNPFGRRSLRETAREELGNITENIIND